MVKLGLDGPGLVLLAAGCVPAAGSHRIMETMKMDPFSMLGSAVSAGLSYFGGQKTAEANQANMQAQIAMQKEFAKNGIRWRVEDAQKAGVHPLYALGAQTHSFSPVSVGDTSDGTAMANMGQDVSRAINAMRTQGERDEAFAATAKRLELEGMGLKNELLAAQIAKLRAASNPPIPGSIVPEATKHDPRPLFLYSGQKWMTDPGTSNVEDTWQKRYGEPGEWIGGPMVMYKDLRANMGIPDEHYAIPLLEIIRRVLSPNPAY